MFPKFAEMTVFFLALQIMCCTLVLQFAIAWTRVLFLNAIVFFDCLYDLLSIGNIITLRVFLVVIMLKAAKHSISFIVLVYFSNYDSKLTKIGILSTKNPYSSGPNFRNSWNRAVHRGERSASINGHNPRPKNNFNSSASRQQ
jgi:hypothetical protein